MLVGRFAVVTTLVGLLSSLGMLIAPAAQAHGSMQDPVSRIYHCRFLDNPEYPRNPACQAAIAIGGTQPVYDWNEVNIANAAGQHRQIIPDGRLCGAGRDKYWGFDQPRSDWPATMLVSGATKTFRFHATAPHRGAFELYVTRNGYRPALGLRWSDLEPVPFLRVVDPPLSGPAYVMTARLPAGKVGRHVIYAIWQRSDSPEAFYSCSDVIFGSSGTAWLRPI
jgi:chitin-binding protein